jgi:hypothetical protein
MLVGVLIFSAACSDLGAPSPLPTPSRTVSPPAPETPAPEVPPLSGPATTYHFGGPLSYPVSPFTTTSRYVLYDNGAFSLHYPSSPAGGGTYVGVHAREGDRISFRFVPGGHDGTATGTLKGDSLEIRYSEIMQHADFEDAVYSRSQ